MAHMLESARLKVKRSGVHFKALNRKIARFMETDPYGIADAFEPKGGWYVGKLEIRREPPLELGLLAGDTIQNLKAALDHLVYALSESKEDGTGFPIFTSKNAYWRQRDTLLAGVSPTHRAVIDGLQPYNGLMHGDPLELLRVFANADKHRVIQPAFARPHHMRVHHPKGTKVEMVPTSIHGPLHEDAEIYRFRVLSPSGDPHMQMKAEVELSIGFGEKAVDTFEIEEIRRRVENIIEAFSTEFPA